MQAVASDPRAVAGAVVDAADAVTVPEAARRLGISERAVRWQIARGVLAAARDGRGWRVTLPHDAVAQAVVARPTAVARR